MPRPVKWIGILVILVVAVVAALPLILSSSFVRGKITGAANETLAAPLSIGDLSVGYGGDLSISEFRIGNPPGFPAESPFVAFERSSGGISLWPLIMGEIRLKEWRLEKPEVTLVRNGAGEFNFARLVKGGSGAAPKPGTPAPPPPGEGRPEAPPAPGGPVKWPPLEASLLVSDGRLVYRDDLLGTKSVIPSFALTGGLEVAGGAPRLSATVKIDGARSEQGFLPLLRLFLPMLAGPDLEAVKLSGSLSFDAALTASGADAAALRQSLSGSGNLVLEKGGIEGAQGLADVFAKAGLGRTSLAFDRLHVKFRFSNGRVYNDDIAIDGKDLDLGLVGWTSFDGRMEYSFDGAPLLALLPEAARKPIEAALGPGAKLPGSIKGTLSSPAVDLDLPSVADAAKKAATDLLEKKGSELLEKKGIDLEKLKPGDVDLGGLFGGKKKKDEKKEEKKDEKPPER